MVVISDAYPASSWSGMVFLAVFTTKVRCTSSCASSPASNWVWVAWRWRSTGFYAALENDIRRLLAFAVVSQVGFKVAGVGIGKPLASTALPRIPQRASSTPRCSS